MKTMSTVVDESLFLERMVAALSVAFGALATLLAAIGLYGVMSFTGRGGRARSASAWRSAPSAAR